MKLLSALPALIGRIADLVDRDVPSNIEVEQTALIQLPVVPTPLRAPGGVSTKQIDSCVLSDAFTVANAAFAQTTYFTLTRGVWRIVGTVLYVSNYSNPAGAGYSLRLDKLIGTLIPNLIFTQPFIGQIIVPIDMTLTLDAEFSVEQRLEGNGVGQSHSFSSAIGFYKLL